VQSTSNSSDKIWLIDSSNATLSSTTNIRIMCHSFLT
jgi:hypothetical protein